MLYRGRGGWMVDNISVIREKLPILQVAQDGGFTIERKGNRYFILCPWHNEKTPSAELYPAQGKGYCYACQKNFDSIDLWAYINGCDVTEAIRRLTEQFGLNEQKPQKKIKAAYDYTDESGKLLYQAIRLEPKGFYQRRPDSQGGWINNLHSLEVVPYRLSRLLEGIRQGDTVYICEGEKDCDNLAAMGLVATTNSGGAGKWTEQHSKHFSVGADVVILPDNDEPGCNHAEQVAGQLHDKGCSVRVINLPELPPKGDVSDWLTAGHTKKELLHIVGNTPYWSPEEKQSVTIQDNVFITVSREPEEWQEPEPIVESVLLPVEPLSPEIIPESLKPWLVDIAYRMQCPLEFVAVGAIVELSSIIGSGCSIRPKCNDDWAIVPNLWGGVVGRPSMLKTPSLAETMKPLISLEQDAKQRNDEDRRFFDAKMERYKAEREALKQEMLAAAKGKGKRDISVIEMELASIEPPDEIARRRFKTNDSTVEKLGELLNENPRGVLVFRDELVGLLSSLDREDRQSDRAFYLEGWNGSQSFTTDRIGRGTVDVNNVCISVLGGIQPSKLTSYLLQSATNLNNDGMIQRFQLLVYPDEPQNWELVDKKPDKAAKVQAYNIFQRLADMDFTAMGAIQENDERPYFRLDDEAQKVFYEWLTELETKIRQEESPLMAEHLAKYRSLVPSLALIFHLIEGKPGLLSVLSVAMACEWSDFLEKHARRIYGLMTNTGMQSASLLAKKIQQGKVNNQFTVRDIYRNCWHMLDTPELVEKACTELQDLNWIRETRIAQTGGRPKKVYEINPKFLL